MSLKITWWERRWITATLAIAGGVFSLISSYIGYSIEVSRNLRVGDRLGGSAFSPDSKTLYGSVSHDLMEDVPTSIAAWDTQTGKRLWQSSQTAEGRTKLYVAKDKLIVVAQGAVFALSFQTGMLLWKFSNPTVFVDSHVEPSPDGKWLFVGSYTDLQVYSASTGKLYRRLDPRLSSDFAVRSDGLLVLQEERGERSMLVAVDPKTDKTTQGLAWDVKAWALSPDGTRLVVHTKEALSLREARTGRVLAQTTMVGDTNISLSFLPDGQRVHIGGCDWIWNPKTNTIRPEYPGELDAKGLHSPDQKRTLTIEAEGGKGRRFPLGWLTGTSGKVPLEGETGWDPTSAGR